MSVSARTIGLSYLLFLLMIQGSNALDSQGTTSSSLMERYGFSRDPSSALSEILSKDEFRNYDHQSWIEKIKLFVKELLSDLLSRIDFQINPPKEFLENLERFWVVLGSVIIISALVLLCFGLIRFYDFLRKEKRAADVVSGLDYSASESKEILKDLADRAAKAGDYGQAVIYMFKYLLNELDESGRISRFTLKTNKELLSFFPENKKKSILEQLINVFDFIKYGGGNCSRSEYDQFLLNCRSMLGQT